MNPKSKLVLLSVCSFAVLCMLIYSIATHNVVGIIADSLILIAYTISSINTFKRLK